MTQAGLSRINQSIEAFVYCILGAQVNVRSSILGEGGIAKEAQTEFLTLMEDAIRQPDITKSVQRYQLAVDEAKVRLNLAVCPGAWLMPARMIINTESIVGYNNKLKQAQAGMKLGVNNSVNLGTKKAALQLMDGGPSKINPPNSHPSNPIHKAATPQPPDTVSQLPDTVAQTPQHEINKNCGNHWRCWYRSPCVIALILFHQFLKKKCDHCQNQEPGMFSKKTDGAPSGFEKKADYRSNKARQSRSGFCTKSFKTISQICSEFFQSVGNCPNNRTYCDARRQNDGCHGNAIFFEDLLYPFSERTRNFLFQISEL